MRRLKTTEVKKFREDLLQKQNNLCKLCNREVDPKDAVLDHNHATGEVRGVLHRGCNAFEGKITNNLLRNKITQGMLVNIFLRYFDYVVSGVGVLHHTHRTPEEKKALQAKRRKNARKRK